MKKSNQQIRSSERAPINLVLTGLILITLYFQTNLSDPFNSPKQWILILIGAWSMGYIISFRKILKSSQSIKITFILTIMFTITSLFATLFTDFKYTAIFGDVQRRNGFLSYASLAAIFLTTSIFVRTFNIIRFYLVIFIVAIISATYAFMQNSGYDFVKWNNPYNSIIGTLGNPNFAAAVMAILGVGLFAAGFIDYFDKYFRVFSVLISVMLLWLIIQSNARQGLLSYFLGISLFFIIWLHSKRKLLGVSSAIFGLMILALAVLGMLQTGPLERFLYKPSVSVRGYYWRAGFEMLKNNPLLGVGMDRYGAYFKQFREVNYPLSYGYEITSSNAHNTFIQLFATGGLFLGLSYIVLNGYIIKRAVFALRNFTGNNRLLVAGVLSAWIAFQAQSLVSIDNIGISIWGWTLGGAIIGLSVSSNTKDDQNYFLVKSNVIDLKRVLLSWGSILLAISIIIPLYRGEVNSFNSRVNYDLQNQVLRSKYKELQLKVINTPLIDPAYSLLSANLLVRSGFVDDGIKIMKKIHENDPRNLDAINSLASTYEQLSLFSEAITYRLKMAKLDKWNAINLLSLGKNYKSLGNLASSREILNEILSFAANDPIASQAKTELS